MWMLLLLTLLARWFSIYLVKLKLNTRCITCRPLALLLMKQQVARKRLFCAIYFYWMWVLNYAPPPHPSPESPLASRSPRRCCGGLKGVGPAESTFLRESHHSLPRAQTLPNSQGPPERYAHDNNYLKCAWLLVMLNYTSLTLPCRVNH